MFSKYIEQTLDWIDNNPDATPVVNEKTTITARLWGVPVYKKTLHVIHTGKYKQKAGSNSLGNAVVKGFGK
jgi:hypothetical protein